MFSVPDATLESSPNCRGFSFPTNIPSAAVFNHAGGKCYASYQSRSRAYTGFLLKMELENQNRSGKTRKRQNVAR